MKRVMYLMVALVAVVGLAGCGRLAAHRAGTATDEGTALMALGLDSGDVAPADPAAAASTGDGGTRLQRLRAAFGQRALHGEATVTGADGTTRTIDAQRGTVTAIDATSVTVTSTDGFVLTWQLGDPLTVVADRKKASLDAVTVGTVVGLAGPKADGTVTARVIIVPRS